MNIFSRLYRVVSSNLPHFEKSKNLNDTDSRQKNFRSSKEDDSQSEHHQLQNGKSYDPVLAKYYANLELPYGADLETVRKAWKKLVRKYHPDLHSTDPAKRQLANELSQGLNRAYEEIKKKLADVNPIE